MKVAIYEKLNDELKEIDKSINDDAFSDLVDLGNSEEIDEKFIIKTWKHLLARLEGKYVGRVILDKRQIEIKEAEIVIVGINGLAVRSDYQNQGVGKRLLEEVIRLCKTEEVDAIFLNAGEELHNYYKEFDFKLRSYKFQGKSGKLYLEDDGMVLILNAKHKSSLLNNEFYIGKGNV